MTLFTNGSSTVNDAPIGDAITVAYVDVVHAHSELIHIDWENLSKEEILAEVLEAMHDMECALDMMKPHVQTGEPPGPEYEVYDRPVITEIPKKQETMQEYMTRMGW